MARPLWFRLFGPDAPTTLAEYREALLNAPIGEGQFLVNLVTALDLPDVPERTARPDRDPSHDASARDLPLVPGTPEPDQTAAQQAAAPASDEQPPAAEATDRTDLFDDLPVPLPRFWDSANAPFVRMGNGLTFVRDVDFDLDTLREALGKGLRSHDHRPIFETPADSPDGGHADLPGALPADLSGRPDLFF